MRARHGNHAVEWDGDFQFGVAADNASEVEHVAPSRAVGAAFLSGQRACPVAHIDSDGNVQTFVVSGPQVLLADGDVRDLSPEVTWTLCGPGVADSRLVTEMCSRTPNSRVAVAPLLGPLAAFGYLVGSLYLQNLARPRSTFFCAPVTEKLDAEGQDFDLGLEGDGLGRMAHLIQARVPVVNQMMRSPCISPFYGRILCCGKWWGMPIFLMRQSGALKYFPLEPISVRNFASTYVPVMVNNTKKFASASGYPGKFVVISVASDRMPGLGTFLRFVETMSHDDFVAASDPKAMPIPEKVPLFRYRRAYNIGAELFREVVLNES